MPPLAALFHHQAERMRGFDTSARRCDLHALGSSNDASKHGVLVTST